MAKTSLLTPECRRHCEKFHWGSRDSRSRSSSSFPRLLSKSSTLHSLVRDSHCNINCYRNPDLPVEDLHHSKLGAHAATLWKFGKITDVTVKHRGRSYPAHKTVLSCYSKYFKDVLMEQDPHNSVLNLQFQSVTTKAFEVLLNYMYTARLDLTCQNIGEVFTASRKLRMDAAFKMCSNILSGKSKNDVHSLYIYVTAKRLGMNDAAERALQTMTRRFEQIVGTPEFLDLNFDQICELLGFQELATRSEVIVYLAALKWISTQYLEREEYIAKVLGCVRFPEMTMGEILACHSPPLIPAVTEIREVRDMLLKATCYVASKTVNEEKRFDRYSCKPRTYLLQREPIVLWDPNIFDPERHAQYVEELAAETIQSAYRNFKDRQHRKKKWKIEDAAARKIQRSYRNHLNRRRSLLLTSSSSLEQKSSDSGKDSYRMPFWTPSSSRESARSSLISIQDDHERKRREATQKVKDAMDKVLEDDYRAHLKRAQENLERAKEKLDRASKQTSKDVKPEVFVPKVQKEKPSPTRIHPPDETDPKQYVTIDYPCRPSLTPVAREAVHRIYTHPTSRSDSLLHVMSHSPKRRSDLKVTEPLEPKKWNSTAIVVAGGFESDLIDPDQDLEHLQHVGTEMYYYIPALDEWSYLGEMKNRRHHHCLVYLNNYLYFIGGCDPIVTLTGDKMVPLKKCEKYDMVTKIWMTMADMNNCRMYHGVGVIDGFIYAVGGKNEQDVLLSSIEVYDPDSNKWTEVDSELHTPTMALGVCAHQGKLWIAGGMLQDISGKLCAISDVQIFDPITENWSEDVSQLPYPRCFSSLISCGKTLYLIGGATYSEREEAITLESISDVLYYDKNIDDWANSSPLPFPRHFTGAVTVGEAQYVLGGLTTIPRTSTADVLVSDETMGIWRSCESLPKQLCGFAATTVPRIT